MTEPMKGFSTPARKVTGPQDLVARMNTATSEDWEMVPLPARQQLGWHEEAFDADARSGRDINSYTGKSPEELLGAMEQSAKTENTAQLSSFVGYHMEATTPPAEPAGAPGTDGYNRLNRMVPPAQGFESAADATVTEVSGGRVVQFAPGQALTPEEQAKVDGAGPHVPSPIAMYPGASENDNVYGTANGVLHGQPEAVGEIKSAQDIAEEQAASDVTATGQPGGPSDVAESTVADDDASDDSEDDSAAFAVPEGTVAETLAWVGDDKNRARAALEAEQAKSSPRTSLVAQLNEKI